MTDDRPDPHKKPRGRPPRPMPRIDATPEQVARAIFSGVKRPDPSLRLPKAYNRKEKPAR
ncbi:MAG: hypothetical protein OYG32_06225 [Rhodospirillaceae bacterium]|nr:hypothetical protein [Rhodospirillaceae bacterium]MDE0254373.1 hypothetical protein [Rhodospirillaceae bacterium]MDE0617038.1 hypothetical protein [Rhodospirillaceae bacterium]